MFRFPKDKNTLEVDRAFLWGSSLYIIPVTEDISKHVETYLPPGKWYDWYNLTEKDSKGGNVKLEAEYDYIPLLIRGGSILPVQRPGPTTTVRYFT